MTPASVSFEVPDGIVVISRDGRGVPFVRAGGFAGLFEGQGYATACDRLWHIEHDRRRARGTLAAVTGLAQHAQFDVFARRVRFVDLARAGFEQLDPDARAACTALAAGVNRRLADGAPLSAPFLRIGAPRPQPMEPWEPLAVFLARHATFATWQHKLWNARVAAALGTAAVAHFSRESRAGSVPVIVPPGVRDANSDLIARCLTDPAPWIDELAALGLDPSADAGPGLGLNGSTGSNAWAVHASRSATGGALVAGDPHRAFEAPNVYYQIGLALRDEPVDAAGYSFPGVPGVGHFAQNLTTAWAVTNAMADYQDLFIEHLDEAVVDRRREMVEVRGSAALEVECLVTRHGPVVSDSGGTGATGNTGNTGLALASTGFLRPGGSLAAVV
ncbi:MAG: penicillin acylase family protein, partial [Sphaerospermopsis kisseleviana]